LEEKKIKVESCHCDPAKPEKQSRWDTIIQSGSPRSFHSLAMTISQNKDKIVVCLLLLVILVLGLYFRTYKLEKLSVFAHDNDLYSWIVKDIVTGKHLRLIGQETSVDKIFIGPLFYYLIAPFFLLFKMDPIGAAVPVTLIGLFTVLSFYLVISKFFGKTAGLITAFLYSVSFMTVFFDRWIVPTQPTMIWSIWYLYLILSLSEGNFKVLPLAGILFGLVWYIHIALAPLAILIPIAIILSKKKPRFRQIILPVILLIIFTLPFWVFEIRHNFQQLRGLADSFFIVKDDARGLFKLSRVLNNASSSLLGSLFYKLSLPWYLIVFPLVFLVYHSVSRKIIKLKQVLLMGLWVLIILLSHFFSKRPVSEYYFMNITVITLSLFSLLISYYFEKLHERAVVIFFLGVFLVVNLNYLYKKPDEALGYLAKKSLVGFIAQDAILKGYPCLSVNYISGLGNNVGFRYFFWLTNVALIQPGKGAPVYNIVIPAEISGKEVQYYFGGIGLIMPKIDRFSDNSVCNNPDNQLLPLLGFSN